MVMIPNKNKQPKTGNLKSKYTQAKKKTQTSKQAKLPSLKRSFFVQETGMYMKSADI
eukprot:m.153922 g.153922  ORF g.153922 m.153922 type:complete len:57 (-) comp16246_c3_seq1:1136-1306(-)